MSYLVTVIGTLAVIASTSRLIPQIVTGFRTKSARDVSLAWEIVGALAASLWFFYGFLVSDTAIMIATAIVVVCYGVLMYQKKIY